MPSTYGTINDQRSHYMMMNSFYNHLVIHIRFFFAFSCSQAEEFNSFNRRTDLFWKLLNLTNQLWRFIANLHYYYSTIEMNGFFWIEPIRSDPNIRNKPTMAQLNNVFFFFFVYRIGTQLLRSSKCIWSITNRERLVVFVHDSCSQNERENYELTHSSLRIWELKLKEFIWTNANYHINRTQWSILASSIQLFE